MSTMRKLAGLWIVLIAYVALPFAYYFMVRGMDRSLGLPPLFLGELNIFLSAVAVFAGLFWSSWAYGYLHFVGKGSPVELFGVALYPTRMLVTTGPYAYTRNPMLIGLIFLLAAAAFYANSITGAALLPVAALIALVYIRAFEEPVLARRFGRKYERYKHCVSVLFPTIRPHVCQ